MKIELKPNESCPLKLMCIHANPCRGADSDRDNSFTCTMFEGKNENLINDNYPLSNDSRKLILE